jgi:hypothetical protein
MWWLIEHDAILRTAVYGHEKWTASAVSLPNSWHETLIAVRD